MNIPHSAIEPFGYTGIPMLSFDTKTHSRIICDAVHRYALTMSKCHPDIPALVVFERAVYFAKQNGANWAQCQLWKTLENGDRIFTLHFNHKGYPRVASFGFEIGSK